MACDPTIFIMEDEENDPFGGGFYDCIVPAMQNGLKKGKNIVALWARSAPEIKDDTIFIDSEKEKKEYELLDIGIDTIKRKDKIKDTYSIKAFSLFILDNWMAKGRDRNAGIRVAEQLGAGTKVILFTKKDFPIFSEGIETNISRVMLSKKTPERISEAIRATIEIDRYEKLMDSVVAVNKTTSPYEEVNFKNAFFLDSTVTDPEDLAFSKGYVELWDNVPVDDIIRLINLAKNTPTPIVLAANTIDNDFREPAKISKNGILLINGTNINEINRWLARLSQCPTVVGGKRMARIMQTILTETRDISVKKESKNNRGIFLQGPTGVGKTHLSELIHCLSNHYHDDYKKMEKSAAYLCDSSDNFARDIFGSGEYWGTSLDKKKITKGKIETAKDNTLFIDEVGELGELQSIFLTILQDGGPYNRIAGSANDGLYAENVKFILATNKNLRTDLKARCLTLDIGTPTPDEISLIARYFALKMGKVLSDNALEALKGCRCDRNLRGIIECIQKAAQDVDSYWVISKKFMIKELPKDCTLEREVTAHSIESRKESFTDYVEDWWAYLSNNKGKKSLKDINRGLPDGSSYRGSKYAGFGIICHLVKRFGNWKNLRGRLTDEYKAESGYINRGAKQLLRELDLDEKTHEVVFLYKNKGFNQLGGDDIQEISDDTYYDFVVIKKNGCQVFAPENNHLKNLVLLEMDKLQAFDVRKILDLKSKRAKAVKRK